MEKDHYGRMNDPDASAFVKGICGDEMEFYLVIKDRIIQEARFYTDGCEYTRACGGVVAGLAESKSVEDALGISPRQVVDTLKDLPEEHRHCSILAVSTLYRAIADYLLKF